MQVGCLWLKEDKDGKRFFTGKIEWPGMDMNIAIFKNDKKEEGSNQPDYHIQWSNYRKETVQRKSNADPDW